jgi:hypothetical protein
MGLWLQLLGTVGETFRIGFNRAVVDSTALTSERVYDLPDKPGTFALLDDISHVGTDFTASEDLAAGDLINIWNDSGTPKARLANGSASKQADGFVLDDVASGDPATVYSQGVNDQVSGMTGGVEQYLSASVPGGITATPPTGSGDLVQRVGKAFSATSFDFKKGVVFKR